MLPVVNEFHIGRVSDHRDKDTPRHKDTTTQSNHQRIGTNIGQPGFLERLVLLHGNEGRRDAGSLVATLACQGGAGYNKDTKKTTCVR
jgi:hypothetical protein